MYSRSPRKAENTEGSVASRPDQILLIPGLLRRKGRCHVMYELAAIDSVRPSLIAFQIGNSNVEALVAGYTGTLEHAKQVRSPACVTDGCAHPEPALQQLCND